MAFEEMMRQWKEEHLSRRSGERLRRLKNGFDIPEQMLLERVIYPIVGALEDLHPEYEVSIEGEKPMFLDIAFIQGGLKFDFELDGYGPHQRDIDRYRFARDRQRDLLLMAAGWRVMRFAYDDVAENVEEIREKVRRIFRRFSILEEKMVCKPMVREFIRYAFSRKDNIVRVRDVQLYLGIGKDQTRRMLRDLAKEGIVGAMGNTDVRVCRYKLNGDHPSVKHFLFDVM